MQLPAETSLLIVAHGTDLNENSAVAAKREAEKIRALGKYAAVLNVYMEEAPLVSDWRKLTKTPNVVVVPFFISDGLHSYEDIPRLLGIKDRTASQRVERRAQSGGSDAARLQHMKRNLSPESVQPSMVAICFTLHPSAPTQVLLTSLSSRRTRPQKVEIVLALGFLCARLLPRE